VGAQQLFRSTQQYRAAVSEQMRNIISKQDYKRGLGRQDIITQTGVTGKNKADFLPLAKQTREPQQLLIVCDFSFCVK
jgi:hypothetical protein